MMLLVAVAGGHVIPGDERRSEEQVREEITELMFAALTNLDQEIRRIMKEAGLSLEEEEWLEEMPDA